MIGPKEELAQFVWSQMTDKLEPTLVTAVTDSLLAMACHQVERQRPDLAAQMTALAGGEAGLASIPTLRAVVAVIWQEGFVAALSALEDGAISVVEEGTSPQGVN